MVVFAGMAGADWEKAENGFLASVRAEVGKPTKILLVPLTKGFYAIETAEGQPVGNFTATRADGKKVTINGRGLFKAFDPTTVTITTPAYYGPTKVVLWKEIPTPSK
jgi:hypothetical protein